MKKRLLIFSLLAIQTSSSLCLADTTNTTNSSSTTKPPFKLQATKIEVSLDQLNDVGLDLKHVLTCCRHLYDEVSIRPMNIITEPEMIGTGVVINLPVAMEPTEPPKPPRKQRVNLIMSEIRPVIELLKQNGDQFLKDNEVSGYPQSVQDELAPLLKKWIAYTDDVLAKLIKLEELTPGPTYDNYAIAQTTRAIEDDIKQIDDVRRPIYKLVQEEGKRIMDRQNNS